MKPVWDEKEKNSKKFNDVLLEAGEYTGKIKKCDWTQSEYMINQYNPDGDCLSVWVDVQMDDGSSKRLFDRISVTNPSRLNALRTALSLKPIKKGDNFNEKELLGKMINIEVDEYTSKAGKVSNIIKEYSPVLPGETQEKWNSDKGVPF
jgi:hypothetical protein